VIRIEKLIVVASISVWDLLYLKSNQQFIFLSQNIMF